MTDKLPIERLEELAKNEAACAESLSNCDGYDVVEDLQLERQERLDTCAAIRELISIRKAEPVAWLNSKHGMAATVEEFTARGVCGTDEIKKSPAYMAGELSPLIVKP